MKQFLSRPENIYVILVLVLILSKLTVNNLWLSDQLIIFNFLSILMITVILSLLYTGKKSFLKYLPLIIIVYAFFNPSLLRYLFFISHLLILILVIYLILRRKIDTTVVPLEIMILFFFL